MTWSYQTWIRPPTFGAVYGLAATQGTAGRGALLSVVYCLGLGVPFVLVAMGLGWVSVSQAQIGFEDRLRLFRRALGTRRFIQYTTS